MSTTPMVSESLARPLRTAPQGGLAWALTEGIDAFVYDLSQQQYGIALVLLTMLFSFLQTAIEQGIGKAFLRTLPNTPEPVVGEDHTA
jgi:hypothetical protein